MTRRELLSAIRWGVLLVLVIPAAYMVGWVVLGAIW